jgi:beta-lactamase regulating signal transducer with metallopeptidase domain
MIEAAVVPEEKNRMIEHIARTAYYFEVHLLYASLVWFAALALTAMIRGSATTKYWIWVATSLNFVVPVGALLDKALALHISGARPLTLVGRFGLVLAENAVLVGAIWMAGALLMLTRLCLRIRTERQELLRQSIQDRSFIADGVPVEFAGNQAPVVNGVLHSRISLPEGIDQLLTESELTAVLLHEVTHAKRRDNLIRLIHEAGLCLLWFHPLMWITGSRLALYREFSCDERVIQNAYGPDLVSALAKLTNLETPTLLQASASSFMGRRLARLAEPPRTGTVIIANASLVVLFAVTAAAGICGTVAHTACCFILRK